mmetsp:Transcript_61827/g.199366  ORF Transcript_61827/g.199366 Transcript_61827/m.199366 type:complete len:261 (+) Transcript_61827:330-1112(+)
MGIRLTRGRDVRRFGQAFRDHGWGHLQHQGAARPRNAGRLGLAARGRPGRGRTERVAILRRRAAATLVRALFGRQELALQGLQAAAAAGRGPCAAQFQASGVPLQARAVLAGGGGVARDEGRLNQGLLGRGIVSLQTAAASAASPRAPTRQLHLQHQQSRHLTAEQPTGTPGEGAGATEALAAASGCKAMASPVGLADNGCPLHAGIEDLCGVPHDAVGIVAVALHQLLLDLLGLGGPCRGAVLRLPPPVQRLPCEPHDE